MNSRYILVTCSLLSMLCVGRLVAQNVGVGTTSPHTSALLDVQSTTKGAALPSMTSAQRKAIASPKPGLLVFDLDKNTLFMYDGAQWQAILFSSEGSLPPVKRIASDGAEADFFGNSVSISGDYAVVGAPGDDIGGDMNQGSAYVFFRSGSVWTQQDKITASDGAADDGFGSSVSISGNYIIVGAPGDNGLFADHGSAYVFIRSGSTWTEQDHLFASNPAANDRFGFSVAISGDYAVIGSPFDDVNGNNDQGSAYFFVRSGTNWTQQDNVIAPFGAASDNFGTSVSIQGDDAIVGAPNDDVNGNNDQGSAHVFVRVGSSWSHQGTLTASNGNVFDGLGESVSIYGDWAVAGAPSYGTGGTSDMGAVYIYHRTGTTWNNGTFIHLPNLNVPNAPDDLFGCSVSITADYLLIGAQGVDLWPNELQGNVYLFRRDNNNWRYQRTITDAAGAINDVMGNCVAMDGFNCIMAASGAQNNKGKILFLNVE